MATLEDTLSSNDYDEFAFLHENASEWAIPFDKLPVVSRHRFDLRSGQALSYLRWGEGIPELAFLHGGAQNAHTWDTVILALGRPAIAVDLPGHGHSDRRVDRNYGPWENAWCGGRVARSRCHGLSGTRRNVAWWCNGHPPCRDQAGPGQACRLGRRDSAD